MAALALTAAGAAYVSQALDLRASVKGRLPAIEAVAGAVATSLGSLAVLEMLGDLDDLEDYGGPIGLAVAIVVLTGSIAMLVGALRGSAPDLRSSERGTKVATLGAALVLGAWVLHLTVGFWSLGPAVWGIVAIVLGAAILLFGSTDEETSARLGVVAVGLGLFAAFTALGQWSELMRLGETRLELGPADILPFLVYVTGIVLVIAGGVLQARGGRFAIPTMAPSRDEA
jgi:hypothetical protein